MAWWLFSRYLGFRGFQKIRGSFSGAPITGIVTYWSPYWGIPISGNNLMAPGLKVEEVLEVSHLGFMVYGFGEEGRVRGEAGRSDVEA